METSLKATVLVDKGRLELPSTRSSAAFMLRLLVFPDHASGMPAPVEPPASVLQRPNPSWAESWTPS